MDEANPTDTVLYSEEEIAALEAHIETQFGHFDSVLHEIVSPDIHVDIAAIYPTEARNYYTLVTMGMGARPMRVPEELADKQLDRAELMICLPPDWKLTTDDEAYYWPIRWLKLLARLPGEQDTWLGWGHSVPAGEKLPGTEFTGMLIVTPGAFAPEAAECALPGGAVVNFYQMVPLFEEEMKFKLSHDASALLGRMSLDQLECVRLDRPNACEFQPRKQYKLRPDDIKPLVDWEGPAGCLATDRITVDGCRVGYMYREEPEKEMPDSGWRFCAGDETQEYMDDPSNTGIFALNTICNYDPDILPLLESPYGSAFYRDENGALQKDEARE